MLPVQRKQAIMDYLSEHLGATIAELSTLLNVSEMTVRRDLKLLEKESLVRRTHGGAVTKGQLAQVAEPRFEDKKGFHQELKDKIARYAVEHLVVDNSVVILEGGTTVTGMAGFLQQRKQLTVVTNGLNTLGVLKHNLPNMNVLCCGGMLRDVSHTFVGPLAEQFFGQIHAHIAFFSASGLHADQGFTDPNMLEVQVKKAMGDAAKTKVMLVDSTKFGTWSMLTSFAFREIDVVVTDGGAPSETLELLRGFGIEVHVVD